MAKFILNLYSTAVMCDRYVVEADNLEEAKEKLENAAWDGCVEPTTYESQEYFASYHSQFGKSTDKMFQCSEGVWC